MITDPRYRTGVALFQETSFFEAHEVLESLWRETPASDTRQFLQGLIQLAVSLEHWRRSNPRGAAGQRAKAREKLTALTSPFEGLMLAELLVDVEAFYASEREAGPAPATAWPCPRWSDPTSGLAKRGP